ncbi:hypothetical protein RJT34_24641 [Clitoria ternatea]|uniref:Uncharacterized protein n=1 Tax=Clitoria ternatea TaxID=43366 RepID=A0AAN9FWP9_CLITE
MTIVERNFIVSVSKLTHALRCSFCESNIAFVSFTFYSIHTVLDPLRFRHLPSQIVGSYFVFDYGASLDVDCVFEKKIKSFCY